MTDMLMTAPIGSVLSHSWLGLLISDQPLIDPLTNYRIPVQLDYQGGPAILVGLDNGNHALKYALPTAGGQRLCAGWVVTACQTAREVIAGETSRTWRVDDHAPFWMGEDALDGRTSLSIGATAERLRDPRHLDMMAATLVQALGEAGYRPGSYLLLLGLSIPNEEVRADGIMEETKTALRDLRSRVLTVEVDDPTRGKACWTLTLAGLVPVPQSMGTFIAWGRSLAGKSLTEQIEEVSVIDIGGGHAQYLDISLKPQLQATGGLLGMGTISLARALRERLRQEKRFRNLDMSAAELQHALMNRRVTSFGTPVSIAQAVSEVLAAQGQELLSRTLPTWQDPRKFIICAGGGSVLLADALAGMAESVGRTEESYLLLPPPWAVTANVIGTFASALHLFSRGNGVNGKH